MFIKLLLVLSTGTVLFTCGFVLAWSLHSQRKIPTLTSSWLKRKLGRIVDKLWFWREK